MLAAVATGADCSPYECFVWAQYGPSLLAYYTLEEAHGRFVFDAMHPGASVQDLFAGVLFEGPTWAVDNPKFPGWHPMDLQVRLLYFSFCTGWASPSSRGVRGGETRVKPSKAPTAEARLGLEASAGWASPSSRGLCWNWPRA